ncbi:MAG TPA: TrmH family RNA methyltransferase [Clostridia bacterium]|nr:TrmH family RNA methyltransferase [Clostridia bacterium]
MDSDLNSDLNSDLALDEKTKEYNDKYKGKLKLAGAGHPVIKYINGIIGNTKPNPKKLFVIEGLWGLQKALKYNLEIVAFAFCPECIFTPEGEKVVDDFINLSQDSYLLSKKVFLKISERENTDGLLAMCALPKFSLDDIKLKKNNLIVVLDGLEIPGNIGTIIRSVDGVDGDGVILCNRKARLTHPKLIKSSQGSNFTIPIIEGEVHDIKAWLKDNNFTVFLTDTRAEKEYYEYDYKGRIAIVAGSERYGISREWYDADVSLVSIPMYGDCDSLNVGIATTIFLYEASLKQKGKIKR